MMPTNDARHFERVQSYAVPSPTLRLWAAHGCGFCGRIVAAMDALCRLAGRGAFTGHTGDE